MHLFDKPEDRKRSPLFDVDVVDGNFLGSLEGLIKVPTCTVFSLGTASCDKQATFCSLFI